MQLVNAKVSLIESRLQELISNEEVALLLGEVPDVSSGKRFVKTIKNFLF